MRGRPKIKTHNYSTVKASLPKLAVSASRNSGVAPIGGHLTAMFPKIRGFNATGGMMLQQPLVNQSGYY